MKVFAVISVALIQSALSFNIATPETAKVPLESLVSNHIPQFIQPLNLTSGELKLFAGHTLQLLKSKCPAVSQERLALLNKYITKLISRSRPVPGTSLPFRGLLNSISTCTQTQLSEAEKENRERSYMQYFLSPFQRITNYFGSNRAAAPVHHARHEVKPRVLDTNPTKTGEFLAPPQNSMVDNGLTSNQEKSDAADQTGESSDDGPVIHIFYTTSGDASEGTEDGYSPFNPLGWLSGILNAFRSIFSGAFGVPSSPAGPIGVVAPSVESPALPKSDAAAKPVSNEAPQAASPQAIPAEGPVPVPRVKRDLNEAPVAAKEIDRAPVAPSETMTPALTGKEAFTELVDNMCRVYCRECMDREQTRSFKAAAKELLQLILTDSTGIELASKHFLEPAFLDSLRQC